MNRRENNLFWYVFATGAGAGVWAIGSATSRDVLSWAGGIAFLLFAFVGTHKAYLRSVMNQKLPAELERAIRDTEPKRERPN